MKFDNFEEGLNTLFKPYQVAILEHIWELNREGRVGINSGQARAQHSIDRSTRDRSKRKNGPSEYELIK